tara:strand:- start:226 stop:813 length:588 start_codon:yes stop_codon:yes gene_type:complete
LNFSNIFERHYFTNHFTEAIQLEEFIVKNSPFLECVTFSNSCHLVTSFFDEILINNKNLDLDLSKINIFAIENDLNIAIKKFLLNFRNNNTIKIMNKVKFYNLIGSNLKFPILKHSSIIIKNYDKVLAIILDFNKISDLSSGAVFLTNDKYLSNIIRCARSSYGRKENIDINISSNGRFSEFQASIIFNYLKEII